MGLRPHGTQVVICMRQDDIKLSPLAQLIFFTHKLVTVTSLLGGLCWCLLFVCVGSGFGVLLFCFLVFCFWSFAFQ